MTQIKNPLTIVQQGGGSLDNYGAITYLDSNNVEKTLTLADEKDYLELTLGGAGAQITINGTTLSKDDVKGVTIADGVQYIPKNFCYGCNYLTTATIPSSVHYIGDSVFYACNISSASFSLDNVSYIGSSFMSFNSNFNSPLSLPKVDEINDGFLRSCTSFNSTVNINDNCEIIGSGFLRGCTAFSQSFSLPSGLTTSSAITYNPAGRFMQDCDNFVGPLVCNCSATKLATTGSDGNNMLATTNASAPMYTAGVTLTGTYANDWKTALPDRTSSPYRKLIIGS